MLSGAHIELLFPIPRELVPSEPSKGSQPVTPVEHRQICDFGVVRRADGQFKRGVDEDDKARALASRQQAVWRGGGRARGGGSGWLRLENLLRVRVGVRVRLHSRLVRVIA